MAEYIITNRQQEIPFEDCTDPIARTIQNAKNLLMTQMGEVPYDRLRGFDPALYHLPIQTLRERLLPEIDRVMLWEPDVTVKSAKAEMMDTTDARNQDILITAVIDVGIDE